jgi:hypothetical protein
MLAKIRATSFFFILRLLDRSGSPEKAGQRAVSMGQRTAELRPGTMLGREWNGQMHRVAVLTEGFAWNGKTYRSLWVDSSSTDDSRLRGALPQTDSPRKK